MRFCLRLFGADVIDLYIGPPDAEVLEQDDPGDYLTNPIGFAPPHGDQRWDKPIREEEYE